MTSGRIALGFLLLLPGLAAAQAPAPHVVLAGDSTVTEGSGWGLGFRRLVDADLGHQPDQRSHTQPPAGIARVQAVDRDDQGARPRAARLADLLGHRGHVHVSAHYRELLTVVTIEPY